MSNLSDFLGGSGGGGDPQATFQASANVANGDLVILNDNGTVAPVTSTSNSRTVDQTFDPLSSQPVGASGSRNAMVALFYTDTSTTKPWLYLNKYRTLSRIYWHTSNAPSSNHDFNFQNVNYWSGEEFNAAQDPNNLDRVAAVVRNSSADIQIRWLYHNGSNWTNSSDVNISNSGSWYSGGHYVGINSDGTAAVFAVRNTSELGHGNIDYFTSNATPNVYMTNDILASGTLGFQISGSVQGISLGGNKHFLTFRNSSTGDAYGMVVESSPSGATWHTSTLTQLFSNKGISQYRSDYDADTNIGVTVYGNEEIAWSISPTNNAITTYNISNDITVNTNEYNYWIKYSPLTNRWIYFEARGNVSTFNLSSTGVVSDLDQFYHTTFPQGTYTSTYDGLYISEQKQFTREFLIFISQNSTVGLTADRAFLTSYQPSYIDTNVDDHFGEAKEAITSGNAGPVAILNRTKDIAGSSFQKGQKLFANPSGSAMATSGTYRVGYATDSDTILVTGDAS